MRLVIVTTVHDTLGAFFGGQTAFLASHGFDVNAVSSPGAGLDKLGRIPGVTTHAIAMRRPPHPLRDLLSLIALVVLMIRLRPRIVHAHTPKAGLLAMMASTLVRVPVRLYSIHGLPLITRHGWRRKLLEFTERMACFLSTRVYCVSPSVEAMVKDLRLCDRAKLSTPGDGSCAGVDLDRFKPQEDDPERRRKVRAAYGIPSHDVPLLCYVGRIARDKGIETLAGTWQVLAGEFPGLHLLACGAADPTDPVPATALVLLRSHPRVHMTDGCIADMPSVYAASDICVLPTLREGLSQVALESGAMQLPMVGTRIPGLVDAVEDGVTGLLVPPGDPTALAGAIRRLIEDQALRRRLGIAGRHFVSTRFSDTRVNNLYLAEYLGFAAAAQVSGPARAARGGTA
jgi:glycosyltransferase involved in cell wall biosynthesis